MTELPAWLITQLEEDKRLREQENQREQLQIPIYEEHDPYKPEQPEQPRSSVIVIEL